MSVFKAITPNDIYITPFEIHKNYSFPSYEASSSYNVLSYKGAYQWYITNQSDFTNTEAASLIRTTDNKYQYVMHDSLNHMFYEDYRYAPLNTLSQASIRQYRELHEKVNILSVPQSMFAERMEEGTVEIIDYSETSDFESLTLNSLFDSGSDEWYFGVSGSTVGSSSFTYYPKWTLSDSGIYSYDITFMASKIHGNGVAESADIDWKDILYITSSLTDTLYANVCYKLVVKIRDASSFGLSPYQINHYSVDTSSCDPSVTTMSIDISGSGGVIPTIYVPFDNTRAFEFDVIPTVDITNASLMIHAHQHTRMPNTLTDTEKHMFVSESMLKVSFEEVSLKRRASERVLRDDGYGNLYDVASENTTIDSDREKLIGEWEFSDGYLDIRDERRYGNFTADTSIYMNHGVCTDVNYADSIYGKAAEFGNVRVKQEIIGPMDAFGMTNSNYQFVSGVTDSEIGQRKDPNYGFETSKLPMPYDYILYGLALFQYTPSLPIPEVTHSFTMEDGKLYRTSFIGKSTYATSSWQPSQLVNVQVTSGSTVLFSETQEMKYFWTRQNYYFSGSANTPNDVMLHVRYMDALSGLTENIINSHGAVNNYNERIYIADLKLEEVEMVNNVRIFHDDVFDFSVWDKFAVECIVELPARQSDLSMDYNVLVTKNGRYKSIINNPNLADKKVLHDSTSGSAWFLTDDEMNINILGKYPFQLAVTNKTNAWDDGYILAMRSDGTVPKRLVSLGPINDGLPHHVLFQKTGSMIELYIDGVIHDYAPDYAPDTELACSDIRNMTDIKTLSDVFIGSRGDEKGALSGKVDCVRFLNDTFTEAEVLDRCQKQLWAKTYHWRVGNVFYDQGLITLTNPYPRYADTFMYTGSIVENMGYSCSFDNQLTMMEVEVQCPVEPAELNFTLNRTARAGANINTERLACFATHSQFSPYVTTVGLYNENAELVAVGKVSKPIKMLNNIGTTFVVKFDI